MMETLSSEYVTVVLGFCSFNGLFSTCNYFSVSFHQSLSGTLWQHGLREGRFTSGTPRSRLSLLIIQQLPLEQAIQKMSNHCLHLMVIRSASAQNEINKNYVICPKIQN